MGVEAPRSVSASGGRFSLKDAGEMPDVMQVTYEYDGFILSYEACNLNAHGLGGRTPEMSYYQMRGKEDRPNGEAYYGANGALFADRIGFEIYPEPAKIARTAKERSKPVESYRAEAKRVQSKDATDLHVANFIECVRSRKTPNADIEIGHRSTTVPHIGNIAYKTKRKLVWDAAKEDFVNDAAASKMLERKARKPWDLI
jgi:hypothetical protein